MTPSSGISNKQVAKNPELTSIVKILLVDDRPENLLPSVHLGQAQVDAAVLAQRAAAKEPGKNLLMPKRKAEEEDTRRSPWRGAGKGRR